MVGARQAAVAVVLTGALALAGCGSDGTKVSPTTSKPAGTTSTTDAPSSTVANTSTTSTTEGTSGDTTSTTLDSEGRDTETSELDTLPDGDHYGYLAGLEAGKVEGQAVQVIIFDQVEFLTGDAADAAAAAAGDESPVPNDYYIVDTESSIVNLAVVPDAQVFSLKPGGSEQVASSPDEVAFQDFLFKINVGTVRGITTVSSIEAVYLP